MEFFSKDWATFRDLIMLELIALKLELAQKLMKIAIFATINAPSPTLVYA